MKTIKAWVTSKKGNQYQILLPAKKVVCPACDGSGTELRGGLKGAVISDENLNDPDFRESYFGGDYDTQCSYCTGLNVVTVVDEDALSPKMLDRYHRACDETERCNREIEAERRYFARASGDWS